MPATVFFNPYAKRGAAGEQRDRVKSALMQAGLEFEWLETERPGQAIQWAERAERAGAHPLVVAGGDGLISEVVNGAARAQPAGPLGPVAVIPLGTANDLAVNLGLPLAIEDAVGALVDGRTLQLDLGQVGPWLFHNNSAVGLEPIVTLHAARIVRVRGILRYLAAAVRAIVDGKSWRMQLAWEGGSYDGPVTLVSVGNNPLTGGLFRMAPAADPTDGRLTFIHGYAPTRWKMLALLPRTLSGQHVADESVHQYHTRWLRIEATPPTPLQVDGEIRGKAQTHLEYRAVPGRLRLLVPRSQGP